MELNLNCKKATVSPDGYKEFLVEMTIENESDVLNQFSLADIIKHYGLAEVLDHIGADEAKSHFDLIDL